MLKYVVVALLAASVPAFAQDAPEPKVVYRSVTEVDFDQVELDVPLTRPSVVLLSELERPRFNPLIRLRTSWAAELVGSVGSVR